MSQREEQSGAKCCAIQMTIAGEVHSCIPNGRGKQRVLGNSLICKKGDKFRENIRIFFLWEEELKLNDLKPRSADVRKERNKMQICSSFLITG